MLPRRGELGQLSPHGACLQTHSTSWVLSLGLTSNLPQRPSTPLLGQLGTGAPPPAARQGRACPLRRRGSSFSARRKLAQGTGRVRQALLGCLAQRRARRRLTSSSGAARGANAAARARTPAQSGQDALSLVPPTSSPGDERRAIAAQKRFSFTGGPCRARIDSNSSELPPLFVFARRAAERARARTGEGAMAQSATGGRRRRRGSARIPAPGTPTLQRRRQVSGDGELRRTGARPRREVTRTVPPDTEERFGRRDSSSELGRFVRTSPGQLVLGPVSHTRRTSRCGPLSFRAR